MSSKFIHGFIFVMLVAMTVHEAHAAVSHDIEICEVCIHAQSNDDVVGSTGAAYLVFDCAFHQKANGAPSITSNNTPQGTDLIRGPPLFS